eukprot:9344144-Prorocentrum_lima.AAC.1
MALHHSLVTPAEALRWGLHLCRARKRKGSRCQLKPFGDDVQESMTSAFIGQQHMLSLIHI